MVKYLKKNDKIFVHNGENVTEDYYRGSHQIVVSGDCIDPVIEVLESLVTHDFLVYENEDRAYVVAPALTAPTFFQDVVKRVEEAIGHINEDDGHYEIRRKIPPTPELPQGPDDANTDYVSGAIPCYSVTVHLGRGYGNRWSEVTILMSKESEEIFYRVQRFLNRVDGSRKNGASQVFSGVGAQWRAVCFAYGISPDEGDTKEAAQRAKKFVYAVVGELMDRLWINEELPSYFKQWEKAQEIAYGCFSESII